MADKARVVVRHIQVRCHACVINGEQVREAVVGVLGQNAHILVSVVALVLMYDAQRVPNLMRNHALHMRNRSCTNI